MPQMPSLSNDQRQTISRVPDAEYKEAELEVKEYLNGAKLAAKQFELEAAVYKAEAKAIDAQTAQVGIQISQAKLELAQVKLEGAQNDVQFATDVLSIRKEQQAQTLDNMRSKVQGLLGNDDTYDAVWEG